MTTNLNGDAGIDQMAAALKDAAGDLEHLTNENAKLRQTFEDQGWSGLDKLEAVQADLAGVREGLVDVAEKIGVGGGAVRDAHLNNSMIRNASKASLGHS